MIFTITLCLILASFVAWAVFLDLKRADQRRRARERRRAMEQKLRESGIPAQWEAFKFSIAADLTPFIAAMNKATRDLAKITAPGTRLRQALADLERASRRRCRWCQILGRVGLAPHAVHYQPRHRAGRA